MKRFPVLGTGQTVPWAAIEPHERQAKYNHYQTLERLAERGGLSWSELAAVLEDRPWSKMSDDKAEKRCRELIASFEKVTPR